MTGRIKKISKVIELMKYVKKRFGNSFFSQICDLVALKRCNPTCALTDYYQYQLFNHDLCPRANYIDFIGPNETEPMSRCLNPPGSVTAGWDKLVFAIMAETYDIPVPSLKGVYKPQGKLPSFVAQPMNLIEDIRDFLKKPENFPTYVKPAESQKGIGGMYLTGYDEKEDRVISKTGERISFPAFLNQTIDFADSQYYRKEAGFLFQDIVSQHQEIIDFTGTEVPCGLRITVLNDIEEPILHRVRWKLVVNGNTNDNFSNGKSGNIVVLVDSKTGKISDGIDNNWPYAKYSQSHPETGKAFKDFTLPLWDQVVHQVKEASKAFSVMKILHWDVVISNEGAVFLELNDLGGVDILQIHGIGVADEFMKQYMKKYANIPKGSPLDRLVNG